MGESLSRRECVVGAGMVPRGRPLENTLQTAAGLSALAQPLNPLSLLLSSSPEATRGATSTSTTPEALEARIQEALACPCVADLRDGPCGTSFVAAFSCFLRDQAGPPDPAGVAAPACLPAFKALQACMVRHPEEFADFGRVKAGDALFDAGEGNGGRGEDDEN